MNRAGSAGRSTTAIGLALVGVLVASAPVEAQDFSFEGSVWSRFETRDVSGGFDQTFTLMQSRLSATGVFNPRVRFFIQAQDVRSWGEETSTADASADQFDFHQAYLEIGDATDPLSLRVGRQEYEIGFGRVLGMPIWSPRSRAYDGLVAAVPIGEGARLDVFGFQIAESTSAPNPDDEYLAGAWAEIDLDGARTLHLFGLHDRDNADARTARTTLGTEYVATSGEVFYRIEALVQSGQVDDLDIASGTLIAAFARLRVAEGRGTIGLGVDRYGGDASPAAGETAGFSDLFGRNHRFLGFADLFNDPRANTGGRGLTDLNLRGTWDVRDGLRLRADYHRFTLVDDAGFDTSKLADEIDLQLMGRLIDDLDIRTGVSWVGAADPLSALGLSAGDQLYGYLQLSAGF